MASLHLLSFIPSDLSSHLPSNSTITYPDSPLHCLPPNLKHLLLKFQHVFLQPYGLPPKRPHDHYIPLLTNTSPINVKPYRYPHSQKEIMATFIQDMLKKGIITPSTSPFSSPVLLVRKKDGSWRFCVDYRALNAVTVKDQFPIPTIDELLDELGFATIFTKIDL